MRVRGWAAAAGGRGELLARPRPARPRRRRLQTQAGASQTHQNRQQTRGEIPGAELGNKALQVNCTLDIVHWRGHENISKKINLKNIFYFSILTKYL